MRPISLCLLLLLACGDDTEPRPVYNPDSGPLLDAAPGLDSGVDSGPLDSGVDPIDAAPDAAPDAGRTVVERAQDEWNQCNDDDEGTPECDGSACISGSAVEIELAICEQCSILPPQGKGACLLEFESICQEPEMIGLCVVPEPDAGANK